MDLVEGQKSRASGALRLKAAASSLGLPPARNAGGSELRGFKSPLKGYPLSFEKIDGGILQSIF